jgi:hypothetical protein
LLKRFDEKLRRIRAGEPNVASNILYYTYLAGIDGSKSSADNPKLKESGPIPQQARQEDTLDQPWGEAQLDYTRRLAERLGRSLSAAGITRPSQIKAVGLLGTDVFDKLLMLQALRPRLPDSLFFTTELDSLFTLPSQTRYTRNLITASGFGLEPPSRIMKLGLAPFRDSYQTATFMGCYAFLKPSGIAIPPAEIAVYEYGRTHPHRLPTAKPMKASDFRQKFFLDLDSVKGPPWFGPLRL